MTVLDTLLDENEAAPLCGVAPRTLQRWRYEGKGPAYVKCGSNVRYTLDAIERFRRSSERRPTR